MKNIVVVADGRLREYGMRLVRAISKNEETIVSLFTASKFKDNESQVSDGNHVIFLGGNGLSESYISQIEPKYKKHGMVWGYNASKAAIYITETVSPEEAKEIENEIKDIHRESAAGGLSLGAATLRAFIISDPAFWVSWFISPILGNIGVVIAKYFKKKKRAEGLQYKLGIMSFLQKGFESYLGE